MKLIAIKKFNDRIEFEDSRSETTLGNLINPGISMDVKGDGANEISFAIALESPQEEEAFLFMGLAPYITVNGVAFEYTQIGNGVAVRVSNSIKLHRPISQTFSVNLRMYEYAVGIPA